MAMRTERRRLESHIESLRGFGLDSVPLQPLPADPTRKPAGGYDEAKKEALLGNLREAVSACRKCPLYKTRTHPVFADGSPRARIAFVGEAPGRDEDLQGLPFVGAAGQLLNKMIEAMGFKRDEVYICNVLKDRPPGNRTPSPEETAACLPYLHEQIALVNPEIICTLGSVAARALLHPNASITKIHGEPHSYQGIPVIPTFHPAYLLRNPSAKRLAWSDLQTAMRMLGVEPPAR